MTKLTDMQLILLSTACQRDDGSLLPPPDSLADHSVRTGKAIAALIKLGMAQERPGIEAARAWRKEGDLAVGVIITDAGRAVIMPAEEQSEFSDVPVIPKPPSKQAQVVDLLKQDGGATLADIVSLTGWLPHTSRAALTGLRKKGHAIAATKVEGTTRYTITEAA